MPRRFPPGDHSGKRLVPSGVLVQVVEYDGGKRRSASWSVEGNGSANRSRCECDRAAVESHSLAAGRSYINLVASGRNGQII